MTELYNTFWQISTKGILKSAYFKKGIDKDNPQSNHFWRKNGFEIIREVEIEEGMILVAEKQL